MKATKENIIKSAIKLFNTNGLVNVRLQHIADDAGISVGNLAYHYYSKKAIVAAIDNQLEDEIGAMLNATLDFPYLIDFDNHLSNYYDLLKRYSFYFLDVLELERAYPKLHIKRIDYINKLILQFHNWMVLNCKKGILQSETYTNQFANSALTIWMIITFWLTQQKVRGNIAENEGAFKEVVWNQLLPLFTETALMEYEAIILPQLKYY
ncbi:TetR/AcrR family transcriptional regulator [Geojedonia litorea]|uniref:TetR/AcrR family transcriptional regulator n=1 Tax=Geojedonia litorea TaxID=1268269 RepID=A0ABV9N3W5_9FLAO